MESILETKAATILEFFAGLHGSLFVTFEEGTSAAWRAVSWWSNEENRRWFHRRSVERRILWTIKKILTLGQYPT